MVRGEEEACGNRGEKRTTETERYPLLPLPLHHLTLTLTLTLTHHPHHPLKMRVEWGRGKRRIWKQPGVYQSEERK
jgi:hypothetical protein